MRHLPESNQPQVTVIHRQPVHTDTLLELAKHHIHGHLDTPEELNIRDLVSLTETCIRLSRLEKDYPDPVDSTTIALPSIPC